MPGCLRSRLGKTIALIALFGVAFAVWRWGPARLPRIQGGPALSSDVAVAGAQPSEELSDSALARFRRLRNVEGDTIASFSGLELTSVLRFGPVSQLPDGVIEPWVEMEDGYIRISGRVVMGAFPDLPDLGPILGFLPDTLPVTIRATMVPFGGGDAALVVHQIEASRIPVPERLIPEILDALGREGEEGLPPVAARIPLPEGVGSVYVLSDSLVLRSER